MIKKNKKMNAVGVITERFLEQELFKSSDEKVLQLASAVARVSDFKAGDYGTVRLMERRR
jgi:hypothetical protein